VVLFVDLIHSIPMILSNRMIHSEFMVLFDSDDSFFKVDTVKSNDSFSINGTFEIGD